MTLAFGNRYHLGDLPGWMFPMMEVTYNELIRYEIPDNPRALEYAVRDAVGAVSAVCIGKMSPRGISNEVARVMRDRHIRLSIEPIKKQSA